MEQYLEECAEVFLKDQGKLFDEPVAETIEEAKAMYKRVPRLLKEKVTQILVDSGMEEITK